MAETTKTRAPRAKTTRTTPTTRTRRAPARSRTAEAKRAAERRAAAGPLERVGDVAGRTVLTSLGATLSATDRVAGLLTTYGDRARAERELSLQR